VSRDFIISPEAEADIAEARDWYDEQRPGLGAEFVWAVDVALVRIQQNPLQYQIARGRYRRATLNRFPYTLLYNVTDEVIRVVACAHGKRHPTVWQERMDEC
jgi:plasmid stabilization system protein ParE